MVGHLVITILNGNPHFDSTGEYTFISGHGSNTDDYILVSARLFFSIYSFSVDF